MGVPTNQKADAVNAVLAQPGCELPMLEVSTQECSLGWSLTGPVCPVSGGTSLKPHAGTSGGPSLKSAGDAG